MNVPSFEFLGFAAIVAVLINVSSRPGWRRAVLLIANVAFLATFTREPLQFVPFLAMLALGYAGMKVLEVRKSALLFAALVILLVAAFCWLKHYTFVPETLFLPFVYFTVGMSYVFFRVLHLIIDAFQDALPERVSPLSYLNYTLNFTTIVSGPIQFYGDYRRTESLEPLPLDRSAFAQAFERIAMGFFKVAIVSPLLFFAFGRCTAAIPAGSAFGERVFAAAAATALFPVYLYFNFSGYTDFVIGVARVLRMELPENFNRPFSALSFIDFWGRWHMTLANWIKTYVYSPLLITLMRRFPSPRIEPLLGVIAYFVAFFIIGVWHGQTTMFLFLGVLLGLGVSINKLYQIAMLRRLGRARYRSLCAAPAYAAASRGLTFAYFAFASLWFWSSWSRLALFTSALGTAGVAAALGLVFVAATLLLAVPSVVERGLPAFAAAAGAVMRSNPVRVAWYTAVVVLTLSVTAVLNAPAPHIVYKGF